jgi:hypothetical protein
MQPDPKHLKNFARNTQWSRGKRVMNTLFLNRSHLPGLERLNARGLACHLIRAIGHHIVRLACRSVNIMARLSACWETYRENHAGITHTGIAHFIKIRPVRTWPVRSLDAGTERSVNHQSRKPAAAEFVPEQLIASGLRAWRGALSGSRPARLYRACLLHGGARNRTPCDLSLERTSNHSWRQIVTTIVRPFHHRKNARITRACGRSHLARHAAAGRVRPIQGNCRIPSGTRTQLNHA